MRKRAPKAIIENVGEMEFFLRDKTCVFLRIRQRYIEHGANAGSRRYLNG